MKVKEHEHCGGTIRSEFHDWQKPRDRAFWYATDRNGVGQGPWRYKRAAEQWIERQHGIVRSVTLQNLQACSSFRNENNDCTVIAVAATTGVPYETAHAALAIQGRSHGKGAYDHQYLDAVRSLGFRVTRVDDDRIKTVKTIGRVLPRGSYIVQVRRHALALVDGKVHDPTDGRAMPVRNVWRIERN